MDASHAAQIYGRPITLIAHFGLRASRESGMERYPKRTGPFGPLAALAGPLSGQLLSFGGVFRHEIAGDNSMALSNDAQIAMETLNDDRRSQHRYRRH
jgi:hypothetical protein